jgi:hydroxysqualene synthase
MVVTLDEAYATCERLARQHYENFPVASWLLPAVMRPHVAAVYAFARTADDIADEHGDSAEERHRKLDAWVEDLHRAVSGDASTRWEETGHIFRALSHTVRTLDLPVTLLEDLVSAFRQDSTVTRYATWSDVFDYCRRSANPVGRLVLRIGGYRDEQLDAASDNVCTALQLTNFWQDLAVDWRRGRLYLPLAELRAAGGLETDLDAGRITPALRVALGRAVHVARDRFHRGRLVCDAVQGRLRYELRATWIGGMRMLERLERDDFDVFTRRPTISAADAPVLLWRMMVWRP